MGQIRITALLALGLLLAGCGNPFFDRVAYSTTGSNYNEWHTFNALDFGSAEEYWAAADAARARWLEAWLQAELDEDFPPGTRVDRVVRYFERHDFTCAGAATDPERVDCRFDRVRSRGGKLAHIIVPAHWRVGILSDGDVVRAYEIAFLVLDDEVIEP